VPLSFRNQANPEVSEVLEEHEEASSGGALISDIGDDK